MKFKLHQSNLAEALNAVQGVVGTRPTLPVLSNALVVAKGETLTFTTTDFTVTKRWTCKAEVQEEAYTLNLKKLEQGIISPLEFQTANNNYLKSQADEMNSLFKYLIKQAVVKYYNGVDYIEQ